MTQHKLWFRVHGLLKCEERLWQGTLFLQNCCPQIVGTSSHLVGRNCLVTPDERCSQFPLIGAGTRQQKHGLRVVAVFATEASR